MLIKPRYLGELVRLDPITSHIKSKISELETQRDIYEKQSNKLAAFGCTGQILAYRYYLSGVQRYNEVKW